VKWYDQSGNTNDATNSTAAQQPRIVDSGVVDVDVSYGKPTIVPDGTDDTFALDSAVSVASLITVTRGATTTDGLLSASAANYISVTENGVGTWYAIYRSSAYLPQSFSAASAQRMVSVYATGAGNPRSVNAYLEGVASGDNPRSLNLATGYGTLFTRGTSFFDGEVSEIVIWSTDQTANRAAIEAALAEYYGITIS
jgi:hypothetical protein